MDPQRKGSPVAGNDGIEMRDFNTAMNDLRATRGSAYITPSEASTQSRRERKHFNEFLVAVALFMPFVLAMIGMIIYHIVQVNSLKKTIRVFTSSSSASSV